MSTPVQYVENERGETTAVLMDITEYESLIEDIQDLSAYAERRNVTSIPYEDFLKGLRSSSVFKLRLKMN